MNEILARGKKIFFSQQSSVLSAATVIMLMIVASRILGLVRQRVLAFYFPADDLALFFAAFRIPDTIFEVLVFGTFSSAFIPVFSKLLKGDQTADQNAPWFSAKADKAWGVASSIVNIGLLIFIIFAICVSLLANSLYGIVAPGFAVTDRETIVGLVRVLIFAQVFFVVSYVLTGVLESLKRFLIPALAPLFYNLGIIAGTILLTGKFGIMAPAIGVLIGAILHFLVQLPLALKLGFKFSLKIDINDEVKKIGKLALPRIIEVAFVQVAKNVELFLASLISTASYTFFTFGNSLQLLPVGLFGTSIAKAALPTLSAESDDLPKFRKTLLTSLAQMIFVTLPVSVTLAVLRIPIVRLVYGTSIFSWEATVQTSMVLSAFAVGIVSQAATSLLARGFYALHDTKTPVVVSISSLSINIILDFILIKVFNFPVWGLALAFSVGSLLQAGTLYFIITQRIKDGSFGETVSILKSAFASLVSGLTMYLMLKIFDKSAWIKGLSFLGKIDGGILGIPFEKFVLDTRYTFNLLILTIFVAFVGALVYLGMAVLLKSEELSYVWGMLKRLFTKIQIAKLSVKEQEPITPTPTDSTPN